MKAVILDQIGGPEQLRIAELADPEPGPGQVRVSAYKPSSASKRQFRV